MRERVDLNAGWYESPPRRPRSSNLPDGRLGGYYPEMNPLVPLWLRDEASKTPASKGVPVRIEQ
jgi:hypothetical protein